MLLLYHGRLVNFFTVSILNLVGEAPATTHQMIIWPKSQQIFWPKEPTTAYCFYLYSNLCPFSGVEPKQCDLKKSPNVYKSCLKIISLQK